MRLAHLTATMAFTGATLALVACGNPVVKDERTVTSTDGRSGDATARSKGEDRGEQASCLTFWLHEDHCAAGNETADDFATTGDTLDPDTSATTDGDDTPPGGDTAASDEPVGPTDSTDEPEAPATPSVPNVVEFRIKAGTANQPWNTMAAPVNVRVGQTLRIINDDTVNHRMHTGGQPCPHQPNNMAPGAAYNCVVNSAYDPATGSPMYDHNAGPTARFYIKATP